MQILPPLCMEFYQALGCNASICHKSKHHFYFRLSAALLKLFLVISSSNEVAILIDDTVTTIIRRHVVITTSLFSSKMNRYWLQNAVDSQCKTTDFLTHTIQKAFNDVSVVTSRNKTANA